MALRIITATQRLAEANGKTTIALFGPSGVGKTTLLKTLPPEATLCVDLEAGMKSVQDWPGDSIPVRSFSNAVDIACLIGGVDPSVDANGFFSEAHYAYLCQTYPDLVQMIAGTSRRGANSAASSVAPAIPTPCRRKTGRDAWTLRSRPISVRCSPKSTDFPSSEH